MSDKIKFDWARFRNLNDSLSKTEQTVIEEHFNIWIEGNPDAFEDCSSPEMRSKFDQFKAAWIMSQMFTNSYK